MNILTGRSKEKPLTVQNEKNGWKIKATVVEYASSFIFAYAQEGDPLGYVQLWGPKMCVNTQMAKLYGDKIYMRIGSEEKPIVVSEWPEKYLVNLENGQGPKIVSKLKDKIEQQYQLEVDYSALCDLAAPAISRLYGRYGHPAFGFEKVDPEGNRIKEQT